MMVCYNDLDGLVSSLIACRVSNINPDRPEKLLVVGYQENRDELFKKFIGFQLMKTDSLIDNREDVWFTDVSLRNGELDWARNKYKKSAWKWCDHHESSKEFEQGDLFTEVTLDMTKCTSELMLDKIRTQSKIAYNDKHFEDWTKIARMRDMWEFTEEFKPTLMKLDFIVKSCYNGKPNEQDYIALIRKMQKLSYQQLIDTEKDKWEKHLLLFSDSLRFANSTLVSLGDNPVIKFVHCSGYESDLSEELINKENNEMLVLINYNSDLKMSFRKSPKCEIDLSLVAKEFSGGGHKFASGGKADDVILTRGYSEIYDRIMAIINVEEEIIEEVITPIKTINKKPKRK